MSWFNRLLMTTPTQTFTISFKRLKISQFPYFKKGQHCYISLLNAGEIVKTWFFIIGEIGEIVIWIWKCWDKTNQFTKWYQKYSEKFQKAQYCRSTSMQNQQSTMGWYSKIFFGYLCLRVSKIALIGHMNSWTLTGHSTIVFRL